MQIFFLLIINVFTPPEPNVDIVPNISGAGKVFEADAFDDYIYVTTGLNFTKLAYIV